MVSLLIVILAAYSWEVWLRGVSLLLVSELMPAYAQGLLSWFMGTFVFYWWQRARHSSTISWLGLRQIDHSASRIELLTSFYKHPLEIASNSIIISVILFALPGASSEAAAWFNLFAASGEIFYHTNLKTPYWMGYSEQRQQ